MDIRNHTAALFRNPQGEGVAYVKRGSFWCDLVLCVLGFSACSTQVTVKARRSALSTSSECSSATATTASQCAPLSLKSLSSIVATPGKALGLRGQNFRSTLTGTVWSLSVTDPKPLKLSVISSTTAEVTLPEDTPYGPIAIALMQDEVQTKLTIFSDGGKTDYPVITADPELICSSVKFYDLNGELRNGTKGCEADIPACIEDGQSNCIASEKFKAIDTAKLTADQIKFGVTIANIAGALKPAPLDCASDGATNCVAVVAFRAADAMRIIPGNIKSGIIIADVAGTLIASPNNCTSDGATNCVAVDAFKAADATRTTPGNIKSGVTIAGVTGAYPSSNYPLPVASDSVADLDAPTFNSKIKLSDTFEYWTSAGLHQTGTGDSDIRDAAIRSGVSIFNISGLYSGAPIHPAGLRLEEYPLSNILYWENVGATGYMLIARTGTTVNFVPVDGITYTAGPQGSDVIKRVSAFTSYEHYEPGVATKSRYALYTFDSLKNYAGPIRISRTSIDCSSLAGGAWVAIPGDTVYGTSEFCVQKYLPYNAGSLPTSASGQIPWTTISQNAAKTACEALGSGYHLMTNPEWMTLAADVASSEANWSSSRVGVGLIARGKHKLNYGCPADANDLMAWSVDLDNDGQCDSSKDTGPFEERRTHKLSNSKILWDLSGNDWQWVDLDNSSTDKPAPGEYNMLGDGTTTWPRAAFVPTNSNQNWWNDSWNSSQGIGQLVGVGGSALIRGGSISSNSGIYSAYIFPNTATSQEISFRCAYTPP